MKAVLFVLLIACRSDEQDKLHAAQRSADEAKKAMHEAEAASAAAQQKLDTALEEQHAAEADMQHAQAQLEAVRKQAADMIALAKKKLEQLKTQRDAEPDATKRAALTKQIDELQRAIDGQGAP